MNMLEIGILIIVLLIVQGIALWFVFGRQKSKPEEGSGLLLLQQQMSSQMSESHKIMRELTREITSVKEIGRQGADYAKQLQNLQDILKNPKQRGILGEYYLETVLKNVLPPGMYQMQYPFKNGEIVDAAVFVNEKIVPIDSKFSLENYNRFIHAQEPERSVLEKTFVNDLKLRIQETAKYIRPEENTMDFAFMFIPSEGIYYDLLTNQVGAGAKAGGPPDASDAFRENENLIQRAASKYKVIIVSPTSFLAYLQTVLQGLKAMQIEETAKDIIKRVAELGQHLSKYDQYMLKLGNSLATSVNAYNTAGKELKKIDKDVLRISGETVGIQPLELAKPEQEE